MMKTHSIAGILTVALMASGCEEGSNMTSTKDKNPDQTMLAQLVSASSADTREYFSGRCGPIQLQYYATPRYSFSKGSPVEEGSRRYAWYGIATIGPAEQGNVKSVEYLSSRGEGTFAIQGRQRDGAGNWQSITFPAPQLGPDRDVSERWTYLDVGSLERGAPFVWEYLANLVPPTAALAEYQFRPAQPHVFRINGTQTCEIMPGYATIEITP